MLENKTDTLLFNTQDDFTEKKTTIKYILWLLLFFMILYLIPLGGRPLVIPDETRYAEIPREMVKSGDWVVPRLNGIRYFEKPPMGYWANASAIKIFGENPFAVRVSSALSVLLTGYLVFLLTVAAGFGRKTGFISSLIYLSFLGVYASGTFSVLDAMLSLFLTSGIGFFYLGILQKKNYYWILSGFAFGCAFLTKGFLAFAVPVIVLIPWLIWVKQSKIIFQWGWLVVLTAIIIALPWSISIYNKEPDFWHYFFWVEHIRRFTGGDAQHKAPFYYFILYLPLLAFPWATFIPAAIKNMANNKQINTNSLIKLCYFWVVIPLLFFSASSGKLATYILPIFPALAILLGVALYKCTTQSKKLINYALIINSVFITIIIIILILSKLLTSVPDIYSSEYLKYTTYLLALISGLIISVVALISDKETKKLNLMLLIIAPFLFALNIGVPEYINMKKSPGVLLEQHINLSKKDNAIIITSGSLIRAVSWYFKREDIYLYTDNELKYGLEYADSKHKLLTSQTLIELIQNNISTKPLVIICHSVCPSELNSLFKDLDIEKFVYGKFILIHIPANNSLHFIQKTDI